MNTSTADQNREQLETLLRAAVADFNEADNAEDRIAAINRVRELRHRLREITEGNR